MNATKTDFRRELYNLAKAKRPIYASNSAWYHKLAPCDPGTDLYNLALQVRNCQSLVDTEILPTFFEKEAVELLLSLPNLYWFWRIVESSIIKAGNGRHVIGVDAVRGAIAEERNSAARAYDLKKDISALNQIETAVWVAAGILVVQSSLLSEPALLRNPVYL
ncbi:MAG: hypothetical protein IPK73_26075 [Candidatus Obscuribacter sp.]|nr:hypothetical protein [Candidatus Obscuribacter sp.]MBK9277593.1 hypothetical protein [Candidatus Obscuribacter sp.]